MKHKPYETWILDESILTSAQREELHNHLAVCPKCRQLMKSWLVSKQLLVQTAQKSPAPGFAQRWQMTFDRKLHIEKVRQHRFTLIRLLLLAFVGSLTYMIASGVFMQMVSNTFSGMMQLVIAITHGLSGIGIIFRSLPVFVPITIGFILFGLINAFLLAGFFTLWNLKNRKLHSYEVPSD